MAEKANLFEYNDDSVKTLDWREHIRLRPGMYIGKLGDGSSPDDGIYVAQRRRPGGEGFACPQKGKEGARAGVELRGVE